LKKVQHCNSACLVNPRIKPPLLAPSFPPRLSIPISRTTSLPSISVPFPLPLTGPSQARSGPCPLTLPSNSACMALRLPRWWCLCSAPLWLRPSSRAWGLLPSVVEPIPSVAGLTLLPQRRRRTDTLWLWCLRGLPFSPGRRARHDSEI
jgi:hypothetical protein